MTRKPRAAQQPKTARRPSTGDIDPDAARAGLLTWRFGRLDLSGSWGWLLLNPGLSDRLHRVMVEYESVPIHKLGHDQRLKAIPVSDLCEDARDRLEKLQQTDLEELCELRLGVGRWRVWGIQNGSVIDLLWWDPEHTVCTGADRARSRRLRVPRRR